MLKVVLLGDSGAGKSALVNQCTNCGFSDRYRATTRASARLRRVEVDGLSHAVQLWDTAGNERLHTLAPQFYLDVDICVLVYDTTCPRSFHHLDHWLATFLTNAGDGRVVVVVGTKGDLTGKQEVSAAEVAAWCQQHGTVQGTAEFLTTAVCLAVTRDRIAAPPPPRDLRRTTPPVGPGGPPVGWAYPTDGALPPPSGGPRATNGSLPFGGPRGSHPPGAPRPGVPRGEGGRRRRPGDRGPPAAHREPGDVAAGSGGGAAGGPPDHRGPPLPAVRHPDRELMLRVEMHEKVETMLGRLVAKDHEIAAVRDQLTARITYLEAQLSQRDARLSFGADGDGDLAEENAKLQEENTSLKDALRRSQAMVADLQVRMKEAAARTRQSPPE
eukprot:TRINITY_DN151_c0_g1_i1.p1 TRINITY_DN151_c0_g1~~TRINITY_DN151_c0_g1_i1.p1  ORF type:complete len:385 (+),score=100.42 TRINITY_DN151_c0_g1_i1:50-1204(+)